MDDPGTVLRDFGRALAAVEPLVEGVRPEQWSAPTPCTDWDVRQLVNHVVTGNLFFTAIVQGTAQPDRTVDHLGEDPASAYRYAGRGMTDAFAAPEALARTYLTPFGEQPGTMLVHMRINELLVHGWDLARATGQSTEVLPDDLAESALAMWTARLAGRPREGTPFAAEQTAPDGAPPIDRLAAFLGRVP